MAELGTTEQGHPGMMWIFTRDKGRRGGGEDQAQRTALDSLLRRACWTPGLDSIGSAGASNARASACPAHLALSTGHGAELANKIAFDV